MQSLPSTVPVSLQLVQLPSPDLVQLPSPDSAVNKSASDRMFTFADSLRYFPVKFAANLTFTLEDPDPPTTPVRCLPQSRVPPALPVLASIPRHFVNHIKLSGRGNDNKAVIDVC